MGELAVIDRFIGGCRDAADAAALHGLCDAVARDLGFDYFAVAQIDLSRAPGERAVIGITSYPSAWLDMLYGSTLLRDDPALFVARRAATAFRWTEMPKLAPLSRRHRDAIGACRRAGLGEGFTVPVHLPGELPALANFVMRDGRALPERRLPMAQLVGTWAFEAARRLQRGRRIGTAGVQLTPRQLDVTMQIARGRTDQEIARALGVSEETVTEHVDAARARYGVARRSQLVLHSIYDGHLALTDALGPRGRRR